MLFPPSPPRSQTPQDTNRASETDTHSLGEKNSSQVRCARPAFTICRYRLLGDLARSRLLVLQTFSQQWGVGASPARHRMDWRRRGPVWFRVCGQGPLGPTRPPGGCGWEVGAVGVRGVWSRWRPAQGLPNGTALLLCLPRRHWLLQETVPWAAVTSACVVWVRS